MNQAMHQAINQAIENRLLFMKKKTDDDRKSNVEKSNNVRQQNIIRNYRMQRLRKEPLYYNSLPDSVQKDHNIARAAIRAIDVLMGEGGEQLKYSSFDDEQQYACLLENLCKNQPETLLKEMGKRRFRMAIAPITRVYFGRRCVRFLTYRGVDDIVYRELVSTLMMGNNVDLIFWEVDYPALFDCLKRDDAIICNVLHWYPALEVLQEIPLDVLCEEHYISAVISHFFHNYFVRNSEQLRLNDIPTRFERARRLYSHLDSTITTRVSCDEFSFPQDLNSDREVCLACLRAANRDDGYFYKILSARIWDSISEEMQTDEKFFFDAVSLNVNVLHHCWMSASHATLMRALLYAIKSHGYRRTFTCHEIWNYNDWSRILPSRWIDDFDNQLQAQLDVHKGFMVFFEGIVSAGRQIPPTTAGIEGTASTKFDHPLGLIACGEETRTGLLKMIASYVGGVPTGAYLSDLLEVWRIRSIRQRYVSKAIEERGTKRTTRRKNTKTTQMSPFISSEFMAATPNQQESNGALSKSNPIKRTRRKPRRRRRRRGTKNRPQTDSCSNTLVVTSHQKSTAAEAATTTDVVENRSFPANPDNKKGHITPSSATIPVSNHTSRMRQGSHRCRRIKNRQQRSYCPRLRKQPRLIASTDSIMLSHSVLKWIKNAYIICIVVAFLFLSGGSVKAASVLAFF